jgi:hypothetical protein
MIKYGLRHKPTGKLLGYNKEDGGYTCNETTYYLELSDENIWMVDTEDRAIYTRLSIPKETIGTSYNPENTYDILDLEVVRLTLTAEAV